MFGDIRFVILLFILFIVLFGVGIKLSEKNRKVHFDSYLDFLESIKNKEPEYYKKMTTIINLIMKRKLEI